MRTVLNFAITALCAQTLYASGLEDLKRTVPFDLTEIAAPARPASGAANVDSEDEEFTLKGPFCWRRGKEPAADRMGMPESLCIRSMSITAGINSGPKLRLTSDEFSGIYDLKIGAPHDGLFMITAIIFDRSPLIQVCAPAEAAFMELTVLIDERGKIVSDPELRSLYGVTPDTCSSPWDYREIRYLYKD